jgi:phosphonate transport system substrate-binding protein
LRQCAVGVAALTFASRAPAAASRYTLAVVPQLLPLTAYSDWSPVVERLARALNAKIDLLVHRTISQFEAALLQGIPDFAFMNPYHQLVANKKQGYLPLVRSAEPLTGILVTRQDSEIASINDLDNKILAFPSPNAFAASLYLRALISERHRIRFQAVYLDTHNDVFRYVVRHKASAGGAIRHTLQREPNELRTKIRVLYETPGTAPHCLSSHERVNPIDRERMRQALLDMGKDPGGQALLRSVQLDKTVAANHERDYLPLEKLGIERYVVPVS